MIRGSFLRDHVRTVARHARLARLTRVALLGLGVIGGTVVACGSSDMAAFDSGSSMDKDAGGSTTAPGDGAPNAGPVATGVVLVHAAAFPAFRLCFSNMLDQPPLPDSKTMPEANLVGVDVGSVVRVDPMVAPGDVYVIDQTVVQTRIGSKEDTRCSDLICTGANCKKENRDYLRAGRIDTPLGQGQVSVLAISGCGNQFFVEDLKMDSRACGTGWDATHGNLHSSVLTLRPDGLSGDDSLPVQLVHLAPLLENARGSGELSISFGALDGDGGLDTFASNPPLFSVDEPRSLAFTKTETSIYASHGFRIALRETDAGADGGVSFVRDESLAEVQALSASKELPTDYYKTASNYALLLLGDPSVQPKLEDGGANPLYDSRRAVHLLAVPVRDPDAGADAGSTPGDSGDSGTPDASGP
ncbi:hypothetical protein AKJ09_07973 [Labilithrix luteola]|uniref:Uncharacterized protein n=1 Tax=Labilithrix luteola TaxID=1391654 RepID=A0A0K1Q7D9_9BACT|nr:hypothetical protein [Labilithrix luteola]AKV01310.1 hypothetical protein AKJ09_07973 [Labilithrix luteola]